MFDVHCRMAEAGDSDALVQLLQDMEVHYWGEDAPDLDALAAHARREIVSPDSPCEIAVAECEAELVALATFGILYPGVDLGGTLYLKDLYTAAPFRGRGIGARLMRFLAQEAGRRNCTRLDWTTHVDNAGAHRFYEALGAQRVAEKVYYRLTGDALRGLAEGG